MNEEQFIVPQFPGAFPDRYDNRDLKYEEMIFGAAPIIDWEKGYDVEEELGFQFPVENQDGSSSCVAQACNKYAEVLNYVEEKQYVDFSPSFIYSQIYLPTGGAYIRDGMKILVDQGVPKEEVLPSYHSDKTPMNEDEYRDQGEKIDNTVRENAKIYQAMSYATLGGASIDLVADAIQRNKGCISGAIGTNEGWKKAEIRPPLANETTWGHAFFLNGYAQDERGKFIKFINSWGEGWGDKGRGKIYEDYYLSNNMFGEWTLVDRENLKKDLMIEAIQLNGHPEIYLKSKGNNKIVHVLSWESYQKFVNDYKWAKEVQTVNSLDGLEVDIDNISFVEKLQKQVVLVK